MVMQLDVAEKVLLFEGALKASSSNKDCWES